VKGGVNADPFSSLEYSANGIRINGAGGTEAPARRTPRNEELPSAQEQAWYQQVVDQTVASSLMHRYGTLAEQANAILFLASDEASYITGVTLPVAGGDLG
jgi:dihydroxycyclohexadiene carboxylate dehydrogenase